MTQRCYVCFYIYYHRCPSIRELYFNKVKRWVDSINQYALVWLHRNFIAKGYMLSCCLTRLILAYRWRRKYKRWRAWKTIKSFSALGNTSTKKMLWFHADVLYYRQKLKPFTDNICGCIDRYREELNQMKG